MCTDEQNQKLLDALSKLAPAKREPRFQTIMLSDIQGWSMDYYGYKHLYMWLPTALTLNLGEWGTGPVQAQVWINVGIKSGVKIFTSGQTTPVAIELKFSDEVVP